MRETNNMSNQDFAVGSVSFDPDRTAKLNKKPLYLVSLVDSTAKKPTITYFISLDKPDLQNGFIAVKGFFCDMTEEEIVESFTDIFTNTPKEDILDLMLPSHRVYCIRNLVFNANKAVTTARQER